MIRSRIRLLPTLLLALPLLGACDQPTAPAGLVVEALEGNGQEGVPGEPLPQSIGVRVSRADGSPAAGVAVTFTAADGAGTVHASSRATDARGMVRATWRLPAQAGGALAVTAEAAGAANPARFTAGWLPRERMDLVLANAPGGVRLLLHPPAYMGSPLAFRAAFADSLAFLPFAAPDGYAEGLALVQGRPPLRLTDIRWTPGRDTLRLDFPRPVEVPLTIWIVRRPYDAGRAAMEIQLQVAREVWGQAGIRFSDVRWVDATAYPDADLMQGPTPACGPGPGGVGGDMGRTNIYVTGPPVYGGRTYGGYACTQSLIYMTVSGFAVSTLLAHELGHTFGLGHDPPETVMGPSAPSSRLTAGQIFLAHALAGSALQTHYVDQAVMPAMTCHVPGSCLLPASDL